MLQMLSYHTRLLQCPNDHDVGLAANKSLAIMFMGIVVFSSPQTLLHINKTNNAIASRSFHCYFSVSLARAFLNKNLTHTGWEGVEQRAYKTDKYRGKRLSMTSNASTITTVWNINFPTVTVNSVVFMITIPTHKYILLYEFSAAESCPTMNSL